MKKNIIKTMVLCSALGLSSLALAEEYETECGGYDPDGNYVFCNDDSDKGSSLKEDWENVKEATNTDTWFGD